MKGFFLTICLLAGFAAIAQKPFVVHGVLSGGNAKWIYLVYDEDGKHVSDSARIVDGKFSFSGTIAQPNASLLKLNRHFMPDENNRNIMQLILSPGKIKVAVTYNAFNDAVVSGSKPHDELTVLRKRIKPLSEKYVALRDGLSKLERESAEVRTLDDLRSSVSLTVQRMRNESYQFIEKHPDSWASALELNLYKSDWGIDTVQHLYSNFSSGVKTTREANRVLEVITIKNQANAMNGIAAPDFSKKDVNGSEIKLADYRGRYVLLYFWGSWCAPCRQGNPNLIKLYKKYGGERLEFIGIACNDKQDAWKNAIEKDGIGIWKHIQDFDKKDLAGTNQKRIATQFVVNSFPTKILIDRNGKVIARYFGSDDDQLEAKLSELLDSFWESKRVDRIPRRTKKHRNVKRSGAFV